MPIKATSRNNKPTNLMIFTAILCWWPSYFISRKIIFCFSTVFLKQSNIFISFNILQSIIFLFSLWILQISHFTQIKVFFNAPSSFHLADCNIFCHQIGLCVNWIFGHIIGLTAKCIIGHFWPCLDGKCHRHPNQRFQHWTTSKLVIG